MRPRKRRSSTFDRQTTVNEEPTVAQTPRRLTLKPPAPTTAAAAAGPAPQTPRRLILKPPAPQPGRLVLKPPQALEEAEELPPLPENQYAADSSTDDG